MATRYLAVRPDGPQLRRMARLLAHDEPTSPIAATFPLARAADALSLVRKGTNGAAVVLVT